MPVRMIETKFATVDGPVMVPAPREIGEWSAPSFFRCLNGPPVRVNPQHHALIRARHYEHAHTQDWSGPSDDGFDEWYARYCITQRCYAEAMRRSIGIKEPW